MATSREISNPQRASKNAKDFSFVGANVAAKYEVIRHPTTSERRRRALAREEEFVSPTFTRSSAIQISTFNTAGPMSLSIALSLRAIFSEIVHKIEIYHDFDKKCGLKLRRGTLLDKFRSRKPPYTCYFWFSSGSKLSRSYPKGPPKEHTNKKALRSADHADFVWTETYEFYHQEIDQALIRVKHEYCRLKLLSSRHEEHFPRRLKSSAEEAMQFGDKLKKPNALSWTTHRAWRKYVHRQYGLLHELLRTQQIDYENEIKRMRTSLPEWLIETRNIVEELLLDESKTNKANPEECPKSFSMLKPSDFDALDDAHLALVSKKLGRMRSGDNFNHFDDMPDTIPEIRPTTIPAIRDDA
ncbi:MAG: hypothetical protein M1812_007377 [Candelaria pacifica]|nr:MAG: hypothetical protein M1812_007377 [Candelaria pacifica]